MHRDLATYLIAYHSRFMTEAEKLAYRHLAGTFKITHGRSDSAAQHEARNDPEPRRRVLSDDPELLELARDGMQSFLLKTAERILAAHAGEISINRRPRCGEVAKTPKAKQCRFCRHDWHDHA
jgi:hypothetical protein